jgi:hypothetical protein
MNRQVLETLAFVRNYDAGPRHGSYKRVLADLAERMGPDGRVRLSHARLGRSSSLCARQTQNVVHALQSAGVLRIVSRRGYANIYRVLVDWVLRLIAGESVAEAAANTKSEAMRPDAAQFPDPASAPTRPPPRSTWHGLWERAHRDTV